MRIYKNFKEALPEIKRDLAEMGIKCWPKKIGRASCRERV